jgi:hypothetical protein
MAWYDFLNQNSTRGRDAGSIARQRLNARASLVPKGAGGLLGLAVAAPDVISSWNNIRNPKDNIFTDLRNLGTSIQNQFVSPGQRRAYIGSDPAAVAANRNLYSGVIGSIPASANGIAYNRAELELAEAARTGGGGGGGGNAGYSTSTFVAPGAAQGGGFGGGSQYQGASSFAPIDPYAAQNREYERERARVEAMVKANPDMQKQAIADERAKVRDQGMALWAKANPTLAAKVQPGAVGYDTIQQALLGKEAGQAAAQAFGYQVPQQVVMTSPPGVDSPQGMPAVQSIEPTETYGAQRLQIDPEMVKRFQSVLNLTTK